jgi:EAL domain-containing protein (putative c-di-GMP-specific phosphodiesterase class I)
MFNEFRSWLRPLEERGASEREDIRCVEPQRPVCFVLDQEASHAHLIARTLEGSGVDTDLFANSPAFADGLARHTPDLVFLGVGPETSEAIDAVFALGEHAYRGPVQLMGSQAVQVMETVRRMGERHSLIMRPILQGPLDAATIRQIVREHKLIGATPTLGQLTLDEALKTDWIEFWYQPKIDLTRKQIAGVETFARLRHPELGTLPPGAFMAGADEPSLTALTERALVSALTAATNMSQLGIHLRLAVNISVNALASLPIAEIVREHGPKETAWRGLILDVTEEQVVANFALVKGISGPLASCNVKLAIDDFGRGHLSLPMLRELSIAELKLDRAFVNNCAAEKTNAAICRTVVDLAHSLKSLAVGIGVEKAADVHALRSMGCDLGQGFLFGQPMPEGDLIAMLRERATPASTTRQSPVRRAGAPA